MPITKSAKKALRSSKRKKIYNDRRRDALKSAVKEVKKLVVDKKITEAEAALAKVYQAVDKAAKRGVIKKNTAARKKSRLVALIRRTK
jgi:small subunit ribosomal protein S20